MYKSSFKVCGTLLYLSTHSLRCIWRKGDPPVEERCANPIGPSLCVMFLFFVAWLVAYVLAPVERSGIVRNLTWPDLLALRMPKSKGATLLVFGTSCVLSLLLFSILDEDGMGMTPDLLNLLLLWLTSIVALYALLTFEYIIKPRFNQFANTQEGRSTKSSPVRSSIRVDVSDLTLPGLQM